MDKVKLLPGFLITVIFTVLLAACNGSGENFSSDASLVSLTLSSGELDQIFQSSQLEYTDTVGFLTASTTVTPTVEDANTTVTVNGAAVISGNPSESIFLGPGDTVITIKATAKDGVTTSTYVVTVARQSANEFAQQAYIKASNTQRRDAFGRVALSGDTLAVGAPWESSKSTGINGDQTNNSSLHAGAVYVFTREGTVWEQQAYIKASNTDIWSYPDCCENEPDQDHFGESVALYGDTLAVGAPYEDSAASGINGDQADNSLYLSGAVYIFTREGTEWSQQAYIKASNPHDRNRFGESLDLFGDTLAVGVSSERSAASGINGDQADESASNSGAVYVFTREGSEWSQQAYIKASNPDVGDGFGFSVALSGDTLAVGAYGEDSAASGINGDQTDNRARSPGAVYVFTREGAEWSQQAYIKASNRGEYDNFAHVALSGDTLAVGAPSEDSAASGINGDQTDNSLDTAGAVYVFTREGTVWSQQAYIKPSNPRKGGAFGIAIALSGDTLAVGGRREAVYVFTREGTDWSQQAYIKASNVSYEDGFGLNVALSRDALAVGAQGEDSAATGIDGDQADNSAEDSGAVYLYQ